tara:strand:- start:381 stop:1349 length:969 start_codon:yes stop_codon:yes gene_type:complete
LKQSETLLSNELRKTMEKELVSLSAHHSSELDDISNELNLKMNTLLEELKQKSITTFQHDIDSMSLRFNEDCNTAKSMMSSLFGTILSVTPQKKSIQSSGSTVFASGSSSSSSTLSSTTNVAYLVRIQQEYAEMHAQQIRTATTLAEIAREASRLRRDLRESKRCQLLAARARAEIPSLIREHLAPPNNTNDERDTSKLLVETNRRLVNKLQRMSNRYTDLEDELSMSMKMDSNAQYHELHASRRSPREGMTMATSLRNTRYQQRGMSPRSFASISRSTRRKVGDVGDVQNGTIEDQEEQEEQEEERLRASVTLELSSDSDE